ncbi:MAG: AlkA N-terminal domain-containing protein [Acidimicrobiales bacterium]
MAFESVLTTGIYCRAECSATPLQKNVTQYPTEVAAEAAGFRPCLLCRPDRLPPSTHQAAPVAVNEALLLITDGYLDSHSEEQLGAHVGYSARQLRRVFQDHVGATPSFVARSRRAHFARRLLDESDLPMTDVTYASGFASVRQMNRVVREIFDFSPTELRGKRKRGDNLQIDGGLRLRIPYGQPMDVSQALGYLQSRAIHGVEAVVDGIYRRTTNTCGYPGVLELKDHGDGRNVELLAHLPSFNSIIDDIARCRRMLALDIDITSAVEQLRKDPLLGPVVTKAPGWRLPGAWDRFETSIRIILGQQVSVAAASTLIGRLVERVGTPIEHVDLGPLTHLFPSAQAVAESNLDGLGITGGRIRAIHAFANAVVQGDVDLTRVANLDETEQQLTAVAGIGPWTAQLIAGRVMGHLDAFPASDLGVRKGVTQLVGASQIVSADEASQVAESWRPFRAVAVAHLWNLPKPGASNDQ